jgi:hypothetical protein
MAWSASKIFAAYIVDVLGNTTAMDLNTDASIKVALFNNSATPDQLVTSANSAYAAGVWASNGVSDATGWPAAGNALASVTLSDYSSATVKFDAADLASADAHTDLANVFGCQVYDDTITTPVADQGICYNYFGGANSVTSGTFTIVWNAAGIFTLTL